MSATATPNTLSSALSDAPDILGALERAHDQAWQTVDPRLLELCRLRIAQLLRNGDELERGGDTTAVDQATRAALSSWPTDSRFDPRDRAVLAYCEQFVIDVASMTDELATGVRDHLGEQGLVDFTSSLLVLEQRQRLTLAWERLL